MPFTAEIIDGRAPTRLATNGLPLAKASIAAFG
jgi:hypothetical protein